MCVRERERERERERVCECDANRTEGRCKGGAHQCVDGLNLWLLKWMDGRMGK